MRSLLLALVVVLSVPASAQQDFEWVLDQEFEFLSFHDPGTLTLKDAAGTESELDFGYQGLSYAVVSAWPPGKKIRVIYAPERGTELLDPESGTRHPIADARPRIDELQQRCVAQNDTTVGMSACQSGAAGAWDLELNRAYQDLMKSDLSEPTRASIRTAQRKWLEFRDATLAALREVNAEKGGTLRVLEGGSAAVELTRDQALRLRAIPH